MTANGHSYNHEKVCADAAEGVRTYMHALDIVLDEEGLDPVLAQTILARTVKDGALSEDHATDIAMALRKLTLNVMVDLGLLALTLEGLIVADVDADGELTWETM